MALGCELALSWWAEWPLSVWRANMEGGTLLPMPYWTQDLFTPHSWRLPLHWAAVHLYFHTSPWPWLLPLSHLFLVCIIEFLSLFVFLGLDTVSLILFASLWRESGIMELTNAPRCLPKPMQIILQWVKLFHFLFSCSQSEIHAIWILLLSRLTELGVGYVVHTSTETCHLDPTTKRCSWICSNQSNLNFSNWKSKETTDAENLK